MGELDVKIVKLEPMRVGSVYGFGDSQEKLAWEKLIGWAEAKGLLRSGEYRIFGFNNPNPSPGSPNYGYEFWMVVGQDVEPEGEIAAKDFAGGLYAVTRVVGVQNIQGKSVIVANCTPAASASMAESSSLTVNSACSPAYHSRISRYSCDGVSKKILSLMICRQSWAMSWG